MRLKIREDIKIASASTQNLLVLMKVTVLNLVCHKLWRFAAAPMFVLFLFLTIILHAFHVLGLSMAQIKWGIKQTIRKENIYHYQKLNLLFKIGISTH